MNKYDSIPDRMADFNDKVLRMLSHYLNNAPDFIKKESIDDITRECDVSAEYAFSVLLAAACGLNINDNCDDREIFGQYFLPMIHPLKAEAYSDNSYYRDIKIPDIKIGNCELKHEYYKPYEAFVCNDLEIRKDGRILPQIGYFNCDFAYPAILENGRVWMTITPNEIETMKLAIEKASGNVLTFGLGLGYYVYMVSEKEEVATVTVVEQNKDVIHIFKTYIMPQFKNAYKIKIIQEDAFAYASKCFTTSNQISKNRFDLVFTDLWHDVSDGTEMYLKMKEYEKLRPETTFMYWIEKSILCYL